TTPRAPARGMTVQLDDNRPVRRDSMLCMVGKLRGNGTLSPCTLPDDGVFDPYIAPPGRVWHWIKLALRGSPSSRSGMTRLTNAPADGWQSASTARTTTGSTATSAANP